MKGRFIAEKENPMIKMNQYVPTAISIDKSKAVGYIDIQSGTTPSGGKIYNVPLKIVPGMNGFQPELAFMYNSQAQNSVMGMGWMLSGCSLISRSSQCLYYDNNVRGVNIDNSDAFMLDGMRLVKLEEDDNYIIYETEQGNIKVKAYLDNNEIKSFDVYYPDGKRGNFGWSSNNFGKIYYPIKRLYDVDGNIISYYYLDTPQQVSKITYNGVAIDFEYTSREDEIENYIGGINVGESKLLSKVKCTSDGVLLGEYDLSYGIYSNVSCLEQIDYNVNGEAFNPLQFYYGENCLEDGFKKTKTQLYEWHTAENQHSIKAFTGKFDYESGEDGLISVPGHNPYWECYENGGWQFKNMFDGNERIFLYADLSENFPDPYPNLITEPGFVDILCADIYGTQQECVIKINNLVVNGMDQITFHVYGKDSLLGMRKLFSKTYSFPTVLTKGACQSVQPKFYYGGDFNGDGRIEIMAISTDNPLGITNRPSICYVFDLVNDEILYQQHIFSYYKEFHGTYIQDPLVANNNSDKVYVFDYDGDGKTDICHINDQGIEFYTFVMDNNELSVIGVNSNFQFSVPTLMDRSIQTGDFNGDGLVDIAVSPKIGSVWDNIWMFFYSKGNGNFDRNNIALLSYPKGAYGDVFFRDINGDGRADLICCDSIQFDTFLSKPLFDRYDGVRTQLGDVNSVLIPIDVNSHNLSINLSSLCKGVFTKYSYSRDDSKEVLLSGMINSLGVVEKNEYKHIKKEFDRSGSDNLNSFYMMGSGATYPYVNIQEAIPVLSISEMYQDGIKISEEKFRYSNGIANRHGLGFCGFETIVSEDMDGNITERVYEPYRYGMMKSEKTKNHEVFYTNSSAYSTSKILKLRVEKKEEKDLARNTTATTEYTYDSYGYPTKETITYDENLKVETNSSYSSVTTIGNNYSLGFLTDQTITTYYNGDIYSERTFIPSSVRRKPSCIIKYKNGNTESTTSYTYDKYGNRSSEIIKKYNSTNGLKTTYEYDYKGRLVKEIDPIGLEENYIYDSKGFLSKFKDKRGNYTTYTYDELGREKSVSYPDSTVLNITYRWNSDYPQGVYDIIRSWSNKPTESKTYDALCREVRIGDERFNGLIRYTDKVYDKRGNIIKTSFPYISGTASQWNTCDYDKFDRPIYVEEASGKFTSYTYDGCSVTICENGVTTIKTQDALGHLISVADPGGTVLYNLCADGQLASIVTPGNLKTSFGYDEYRRRISISDPSHGLTKWTFNNEGNLSSKTDANNVTINYEYDEVDRLTKQSYDGIETIFTYNNYGDLTEVTSTNGTSKVMGYDAFGRIEGEKVVGLDKKWLQKKFTYQNGNLISTTFMYQTNTPIIEKYVYSHGHKSEVKLNESTCIYKLSEENTFGQPIKVVTGPITRNYSYDSFGIPIERSASIGDTQVQHIKYTYDFETGNMLSREDNGVLEEFGYDNLNRLTSYGDRTISYDSKGNITRKSGIGMFEYTNNMKPYALSKASITGNEIPSNIQNVYYTPLGRVSKITESLYEATFDYDFEGNRVRMKLNKDKFDYMTRHYLGNCYEYDDGYKLRHKLYLMGDYYSSPAVYVKEGTKYKTVYILRDNIGSITHVIDSNGTILQTLDYDAWGRLCDASTKTPFTDGQYNIHFLYLGRGYTGHEHLPEFGVINMNARLYDPVLGRFLSPDPYVQDPEGTQNFNRYSYALNNPMKYKDPNGEFLFLSIVATCDLIKNLFRHGFDFKSYDWTKTSNAWKIDRSIFRGSFTQVLNKLTFSAMNTGIGNIIAHGYNLFGHRGKATELEGVLALPAGLADGTAVTFGHYTIGPVGYTATYKDHLFVHEYGHFIQSMNYGNAYLYAVAIPSVLSAAGIDEKSGKPHKERWFEVDASRRGAKYFDKKYGPNSLNSDEAFDKKAFFNGGGTLYQNPRELGNANDKGRYPQKKVFPYHFSGVIFWDFFL